MPSRFEALLYELKGKVFLKDKEYKIFDDITNEYNQLQKESEMYKEDGLRWFNQNAELYATTQITKQENAQLKDKLKKLQYEKQDANNLLIGCKRENDKLKHKLSDIKKEIKRRIEVNLGDNSELSALQSIIEWIDEKLKEKLPKLKEMEVDKKQ